MTTGEQPQPPQKLPLKEITPEQEALARDNAVRFQHVLRLLHRTGVLNEIEQGDRAPFFFDIAGGAGDPAIGFLTATAQLLPDISNNARYLVTDIEEWYGQTLSDADILQEKVVSPIKDGSISIPWSEINTAHQQFERSYGEKWDATNSDIFEEAKKLASVESIGVIVLRHPELGDPNQKHLIPIFEKIINNILDYALSTDTPVLITTSTNQQSLDKIQQIVNVFFREKGEKIYQKWDYSPAHMPKEGRLEIIKSGEIINVRDRYIWIISPKRRK